MKNLLIGAISGNYSIEKIRKWVESSNYRDKNFKRVLIIFNIEDNISLEQYCKDNNIEIVLPTFDYWGNNKNWFEHHTAKANISSTYELIHNLRFLYINKYLDKFSTAKDNIIVTDVSDVRFNSSKFPFDFLSPTHLVATSEMIKYKEHNWNYEHLHYNLGILGKQIENEEVLNVGVFGGPSTLVKNLSRDIYLMSVGKPKVADQTSFNFLARTTYLDKFIFSQLKDKFAIHCHVINEGKVKFDLNTLEEYTIIHQYDRLT